MRKISLIEEINFHISTWKEDDSYNSLPDAIKDSIADLEFETEVDESLTEEGVAADAAAVGDALKQLREDLIGEINYKPLSVTFSISPAIKEKGDSVE
jgi:hypothetical protein